MSFFGRPSLLAFLLNSMTDHLILFGFHLHLNLSPGYHLVVFRLPHTQVPAPALTAGNSVLNLLDSSRERAENSN